VQIIAIIPARGGSKGVPRKNIKLLGGKPLIWYTYEAARASHKFSDIILSTDDLEIASVAREFGLEVQFMRPAHLATDSATSIDVVNHCLDEMKLLGKEYDAVMLLQPTSPFREKGLLENSIDVLIKNKADSLVSVRKVPHQFNPHWLFEEVEEGLLKISTGDEKLIPRRQELPNAYYRDGQIYLTKTNVLQNKKSFIGDSLTFIENVNMGSLINIDNLSDWDLAERFLIENIIEF
jgi:CMP-N,N'-diacetyllegionaminic acid synthase